MKVKNCSEFLIQTEISKIYYKVRLLKESLEIPSGDEDKEEIEKIIDDSVESIEKINSDYEKKLKEAKKKFGKIKMKSQTEFEWSQSDSEEVEEIEEIQKEIEVKTKKLIEEIIPKKSNSEEVKKVKKNIITSIYDDLTQNSKKLLISALLMTLGYVGVNKIFTNNKEAQKSIEYVKKTQKSDVVARLMDFLKGQESEKYQFPENMNAEHVEKIKSEIEKFEKKGFQILTPEDMKVGEKFDKSKTVFLSAHFPYPITNQSRVDIDLSNPKRVHLYDKYLPIIDLVVEEPGLKLLALSMAYFEGYEPGTVAYKTNNPGNVGNTDEGKRRNFPNLKKGIQAQIEHILKIVDNKSRYYPVGEVVSVSPYYSKELKKTVPGFLFVYEGTLEQFLKIYATGPRDHNNYMNAVLTFFNTYYPEANVKPETKISEIIQIGRKGSSLKKLIDSKRNENKEQKKK
jgi:hypothetical protein